MWQYCQMQEEIVKQQISEEQEEKWLDGVAYLLEAIEDTYPDAEVLDHLRGNLSIDLINEHPEIAVKVANGIRSSGLGARLAITFIERGYEAEAIEVSTALSDPKLTAYLLLGQEWRDTEAPSRRLAEIVQSDEYPAEKRIGCLEFIVNGLIENGELESAARYQRMIDELKD